MLVRNSSTGVNCLSEPHEKVHFPTNLEHDRLLKITRLPTLQLHLVVVLSLATGASHGAIGELGWRDIDHRIVGRKELFPGHIMSQ